jgi:hypothetical protein
MQSLTYHFVDKSDWGEGPWQEEPDKMQWMDPGTGLPCLIVRGPHGNLCGYVGVPEEHPAFGERYDDVDVEAHGGLTFSDRCYLGEKEQGVCHTVEPGESDVVWWLGFDCAHGGDLCPKFSRHRWHGDVYRDIAYVRQQVLSLARQLVVLAGVGAE